MSERIHIGPRQSLVTTVANLFSPDSRDCTQSMVVFPGRRPAHFLRKSLARRLGGSYLPPRIFSMDDFVRFLWDRMERPALKEVGPLDAVVLLHEVHTGLTERIGGNAFMTLESFLPLGFKLFGELEELRLAMLPEREIRDAIAQLAIERTYLLPEYFQRFYELVSGRLCTTRALRYADVAASMDTMREPSEGFRVILAGLYKMTRAEQMIVDALSRRPSTLLVFQDHLLPENDPGPVITFVRSTDTHGQVFAVAESLRRRVAAGEVPDERSVVVLPESGALLPMVYHALSVLQPDQYNIALGYPVPRTPVAGFLSSLLELLQSRRNGKFAARAYVRFLLHPYTKNIRLGQRTDIPRILMHTLEAFLTEERAHTFVHLETIEQLDEIFTRVAHSASDETSDVSPTDVRDHLRAVHDALLRPFAQISSVGDLARKLINALTFIAERSTAALHPLFRANAETVVESLGELERSLLAGVAVPTLDGYQRLLREHLSSLTVPFPGTPVRGLQVLGLLETRGLVFDDVTILNVNDDILPGGEGADALLPQAVREKLHLETLRDRDELTGHYFRLLINGARNVTLYFTEGEGARKSRFAEQLLWRKEQLREDVGIQTVHYRVRLGNGEVSPLPKTDAVLGFLGRYRYSATSLNKYLRCPLQFYYSHVLRLEEKEEMNEGADASDIGSLVHTVLREYFASRVGLVLTPELLDETRMEEVAAGVFDRTFGKEPSPGMFLMRDQVIRQLTRFISAYQRPVAQEAPVTITDLERTVDISFGAYSVRGKLDRVERRGEKVMILDYKTGARPNSPGIKFDKLDPDDASTWIHAVESLQLPMYLILYAQAERRSVEDVIPAYLWLGANTLSRDIELPFGGNGTERRAYAEVCERLLMNILRQINDPAIPFNPPTDLLSTCPGCAFQHICGTQWIRERD